MKILAPSEAGVFVPLESLQIPTLLCQVSPNKSRSKLEALDSLVISTIYNVSSKLCGASAGVLRRAATVCPEQDEDQVGNSAANIKCHVSSVKCLVSSVKCQVSSLKCQVSSVKCQVSRV